MGLMEQCEGERVHTRNISVATYGCGTDHILVEGILKDDRLKSHYLLSGEKRPPDTVHHMIVRILVDTRSLTITAVETEMPDTPHDTCIETRDSLNALVGLTIAPGFTSRVKKAVGGVKGCVHLTALLLTMAPAAVQGYWAHMARKPAADALSPRALEQYLIDTCRVWRRDGPLAAEAARAMARKS